MMISWSVGRDVWVCNANRNSKSIVHACVEHSLEIANHLKNRSKCRRYDFMNIHNKFVSSWILCHKMSNDFLLISFVYWYVVSFFGASRRKEKMRWKSISLRIRTHFGVILWYSSIIISFHGSNPQQPIVYITKTYLRIGYLWCMCFFFSLFWECACIFMRFYAFLFEVWLKLYAFAA